MISTADVVVVGSGGLGAATAHYLAKRRVRVALLDKHEIGSQTSPRAAGMVSCVRKGDLMIKLVRFFDMQSLGPGFDIKDMPLDMDVLRSAADEVQAQIPILQTAGVRELRGGIPTMTADGHHILGPTPSVRGFFFASGCNVAGLSISPTVGEALAAWIVDGKPSVDLSSMTLARFNADTWSEERLQQEAAWQYRHFYGAA